MNIDDTDGDQTPESQFAKDLKHATRQQLGRKRQRLGIAPRKKRLDPALQGLMGEANLRFARGDTDTAIRMCMEVIRQEPGVPEPFQTLSTLYEETGNEEKAFQFALIAAHLAPQDAEEWGRLADMSLEQGDRTQAVACFRKAVDADPQCLKYHWSRCDLLEQLGEKSKALMAFKRMLSVLKGIAEDPEESREMNMQQIGLEYIRAARQAARLLHERNSLEDARKVIQEAINLYPSSVESGDINLLLDLLMCEQLYEEAMEVICEHCDAKFEASKNQSELSELESNQQLQAFSAVNLPDTTPLEIYSKLVVILLQLNSKHLVNNIAKFILDEDPEEYGDLMLDVGEAYMSKEMYQESLPFLEKLVHSVNYGQAAVWLRYGESLYGVGKLDDAEMAYKKVVGLAPQHHDARRSLSNILKELGRPDEALLTLDQDEEAELLNPSLLYAKCNLLYTEARMDEFACKAELLLSRHFTQIRNKEEMYAIAAQKRLNKKNKAIAEVRSFRQEPLMDQREADFEADTVITPKKEYELFHKLCEFYFSNKKYPEFQRLTFSALGSPLFNKSEDIMKECEFLCLVSSFSNGDSYHAYNFVRDMVVKDATNNRLWNLFNLVIRYRITGHAYYRVLWGNGLKIGMGLNLNV
jgi:general transcription factor 3C polypeptide 3 (transcription factor C subunit 4)